MRRDEAPADKSFHLSLGSASAGIRVSLASNRKVPTELLGGLDGDEPARTEIEAQDRRIAEASGKPQRGILALVRANGK